jgi:hypothetical protein
LRLTAPFNLPAPGRRQPLYVVFDFAETCVFVKQSPCAFHCGPLALLTRYRGTPSPEVTGLICRVPERAFSRAPLDILLVYLCRFEVRFPAVLLRGFSWQRELSAFRPYGLLLRVSPLNVSPDLPRETGLHASNLIAITGCTYPSASPHRNNDQLGVPEY